MVIRFAYRAGADPSGLAPARLALAGAPFALLLPWLLARAPAPVSRRGLLLAGLAGVSLFVGAHCELNGLRQLQAAILVLLLFASPIWVVLIERIVWRRRPAPLVLAAIATTISGLVIMVAPWSASLNLTGVLWGLGGSLTLAIFFILLMRSQATISTPLGVATALASAGAIAVLTAPGALVATLGDATIRPYALAIAAAAAGWGVLASFGLRETNAVTATIIGSIEPVFVALLAWALLGETLSWRELTGGAVVVGGVFLAALGSSRASGPPKTLSRDARPARGTLPRRDPQTLRR